MSIAYNWSAEEDRILRELWAEGVGVTFISDALGRTRTAASNRARKMGLYRPHGWVRVTNPTATIRRLCVEAKEQAAIRKSNVFEISPQRRAEYLNLQERNAFVETLRVSPRDPCGYCGTRADYGCKHQVAA